MTNKHIGSNFDDFLEEEGLLEECTEAAIKKVLAFQIENFFFPQIAAEIAIHQHSRAYRNFNPTPAPSPERRGRI